MSKSVYYHGNDNYSHEFRDYMPSFFTTDFKYAFGYGKHVKAYFIEYEKPFDPSVDEAARAYYNENFLNHELGVEAKPLEPGQRIGENNADNFWAYITVEEQLGNGLGYDAIVVNEAAGKWFDTSTSLVPFSLEQIKPIKSIDFGMMPHTPVLSEHEADERYELMGHHTHGYCHAFSSYLFKQGYGEIYIVKPTNSNEIIHSFIKSEDGLSIDAGGVMPIYEMLARYEDCAVDGDVSNFVTEKISLKDLLKSSSTTADDIKTASYYWDMTKKQYASELSCLLDAIASKESQIGDCQPAL